MSRIKYQPDQKSDVPPGVYACRFTGTKDRPPFEGSKFGKDNEPRMEWFFEVLEGPQRGKLINWTTGTNPASTKSNCFKVLRWLLGRPPNPGEDVETDNFKGRCYEVSWEVNPESETGNLHIVHVRHLPDAETRLAARASQPAPAPAPDGPPPRRQPAPAQPAEKGERLFWVETGKTEGAEKMSESAVYAWLKAHPNMDPKKVEVCVVGEREWKTAADYGLESLPF
jgi:hypothetical protein